MASKKTASKTTPAKTTEPANTSAPKAGENADVSATGSGQPDPQASTPSAPPATPTVTTSETPPVGGNAPTNDESQKTGGPVAKGLIVSSKTEGFRRSGRSWSKTAETVNADDFTPAQIEALLAEPMLDVVVVAE